MASHFAARLHSYVHGLFRPTDKTETQALHQKLKTEYQRHSLLDPEIREHLIAGVTERVLDRLDLDAENSFGRPAASFIAELFNYEGLFVFPQIDWDEQLSVSEWWEIKDHIQAELDLFSNLDASIDAIEDKLLELISAVQRNISMQSSISDVTGALVLPVKLLQSIDQASEVTEKILLSVLSPESDAWTLFPRLADQVRINTQMVSSGNPLDPKATERPPLMPTKSSFETSDDLIKAYLAQTPFADLLSIEDRLVVPEWVRFEHAHIIGGSGHGKSQTLQYLICNDLEAVANGERSIVVLDSQGDLIKNIASLAEFGPGGALRDRVVIIDPTDVEYPVSLNLFDVGVERLANYDPLERERLTNSILELYDFVLGSLLSAELTQKQNVIFRYVTRLMLVIPNATIHTLVDLMEPDANEKFAPHIKKLTGTARRFFETEFMSREFTATKKQVVRRLWGILENQTFERMFSHPRSKLDLYGEMNSGKIILINTAKDLLKEQGSQIFGRFFISLIAQAAQERATLPENQRLPTYVYIDEAADYFDQNISTILAQARKYRVGMVLAHQYLGQLTPRLQEAFGANTSLKLAGGVSAKDARTLAPMLHCHPALIEAQPKGHFASFIRGITDAAVSLRFPFGFLENKPKMAEIERDRLRDVMRTRYAVHHSQVNEAENDENEELDGEDAGDDIDVAKNPDDIDITPGENW